mmetsp:Transcript_10582/g.34968  ORF Transcript_10582/g.34968 Transcript_10582/m.34968 type:complete len:232 (-) Transcript_10582:1575-2270(-)
MPPEDRAAGGDFLREEARRRRRPRVPPPQRRRRRGDPRRQGPGRAEPCHRLLQARRQGRPRRDGHRSERTRLSGNPARHQLRPPDGDRTVRPPHRPHGPLRQDGRRDDLRQPHVRADRLARPEAFARRSQAARPSGPPGHRRPTRRRQATTTTKEIHGLRLLRGSRPHHHRLPETRQGRPQGPQGSTGLHLRRRTPRLRRRSLTLYSTVPSSSSHSSLAGWHQSERVGVIA